MVRLASVAAPVTEEIALDHVAGVFVRDLARQLVKLQLTQTSARAFRVNLFEQLLTGRRDVAFAEPSAFDRNLAASDCAQPEGERRGRFETNDGQSLIETAPLFWGGQIKRLIAAHLKLE